MNAEDDRSQSFPAESHPEEFPWKRNLYILWLAQLIAMIGMSGCVPFLPLYIRELGVTNLADAQRWSGLIQAGPFFLSFLTTPVWGAMGDRYGKKPMVVRAIFGLMVAMFLMGFAQNVLQLFFLRILQGAVSGFIASSLAMVSSCTPARHSGYAIGFLQTSISVGTLVGPLLGGVFADAFGVRNVFVIVAALCCVSGIIVVMFAREKQEDASHREESGVIKNLNFVLAHSEIRSILVFIILAQAGIVFTSPIFAYYLESLHAPARLLKTLTGVMIGSVGLFTAIFAPIWGRRNDRQDYRKTLILALPFVGCATIAQSLVPHYAYLFPLRILIGIFSAALIPTLYTALSKRSPDHIRSGVMGFASSATLLANLLAPIISGWVAAHAGMPWCFVAAGSLILSVFVLVSFTRNPEIDVPA